MKDTFSPKELALALDVSESSLKRWVDDGAIHASRTRGGHRRISRGEAIRFVRQSQLSLVRPEVLGLLDLRRPEPAGATPFLDLLLRGEAEDARGWLLRRFLEGESVAALCDGPVQSAMQELGEAWKSREDGVFLEHRATDLCLQALGQVRTLIEVPAGAPVALGGAPEADPYLLPSLMAATSLAAEGFHAVNLGAQTPAATMVTAARHHYDVRLFWVSVTSQEPTRARLEAHVRALLEGASEQAAVVVGGRASPKLRSLASDRVVLGQSMAELVAFAKGRIGRAS